MTGTIAVRGLRFAYPDGRVALDGLDLDVPAGQRVALLGPNGAGKTTLLLHLCGLLGGAEQVVIDGARGTALRSAAGIVFQDPDDQLFMPTVREDVAFGPLNQGLGRAAAMERATAALDAVGMTAAAALPPHALSMGERRRVAIATVLAMRPGVLLLDEPGANLDPRARRALVEVLEAVDTTLVLTTHDLPLAAELCDRAVVLQAGRVVADAPLDMLFADPAWLSGMGLELPSGFDPERLPRRAGAVVAGSHG